MPVWNQTFCFKAVKSIQFSQFLRMWKLSSTRLHKEKFPEYQKFATNCSSKQGGTILIGSEKLRYLKKQFLHRLQLKWLCGTKREICIEELFCNLFKLKIFIFYFKSIKRSHRVIKNIVQCVLTTE